MSLEKTILILGGGIGGIVTARELRRNLGTLHRIILIDKQPVYAFSPSFLWVMVGWRTPEIIQKSLSLLEKHGIEFRQAVVEEISVDRKSVRTNHGTLKYDYLVVCLGAEMDLQAIPGLADAGLTFYSLPGAVEIYGMLREFSGRKIAVVVSDLPYTCPSIPYEAAFLIESFFRRRGENGVTIEIYTPESVPITTIDNAVGTRIASLVRERGISLFTDKKLISADPRKKNLIFKDGTSAGFDMLITIPPLRVPAVLEKAGLTNESGWIPVEKNIMQTSTPGVYAIGDATTISPRNGVFLPKVGTIASNQAEVVANQIAVEINEHGFKKEFNGAGFCFVETGDGRAGYISGNFYSDVAGNMIFHEPNVTYHWGKVVFEKYWLWRWF